MAVCGLSCSLTLLLCAGLSLGQDLVLPAKLEKVVGENAVFEPIRVPSDTYLFISWRFGGAGGNLIIAASGDTITYGEGYRNRASLDRNTLALELSGLSVGDTGLYFLNIQGNTNSYTAETALDVFEPVTNVTITPNDTELVEFNSTAGLTCSASGSSLSFSWLNGSSEVSAGGRVQLIDGNRTLIVSGVRRDDTGPYTCEAFNTVSADQSQPLTLTVFYGPDGVSANAESLETFYGSGSDLTLTCSAESSPAAEYRWAVYGTVLSREGPELTLTNIQTSQSGNYTCTAHNTKTLRYSTSEPISITVLERISGAVISGPVDPVIEGNGADLTCEAIGNITTTEWMKDDQTLSPSNNIIFSDNNRSVKISPVSRTDRGEYRCTLRNPVSSDTAVRSLTVNYGPDDVRVVGDDQVEEGGTVTFQCATESEPKPVYTWEFNGTETEMTTDSYTVGQVTFSSSGNYTCIARNDVTGLEASATRILEVKEKGSLGGGDNLSAGAVAGIVIGVLLGVAAVAGLIVYFMKFAGRPNSGGSKQNGATQNGGEHELNYADIQHLNRGVLSTQTRQGTPAMVRAQRGVPHDQGVKPDPETEVTYSEVRK